jgi:hypothetical protein
MLREVLSTVAKPEEAFQLYARVRLPFTWEGRLRKWHVVLVSFNSAQRCIAHRHASDSSGRYQGPSLRPG